MTKRDREFDNILNECLERLLVKDETIEQCLASHPELADTLKPLLQTAAAAKKATNIEPRPEFRARARYQFRSALQEVASRESRPVFSWRFRWATAVATVLILLLANGGMVAAAMGSMPDEPLYPVKLAVEQLQLNLTTSPLDKAKLYAELSDRRVTEIIHLAQEGKAGLAEVVTQRLDNQLAMIASLAITITRKEESKVLEGALLVPATEMDVQESQEFHQTAGSGDDLSQLLEQYAASHSADLNHALEAAPEGVKPVLLQAIEVSLAGYEKALNALSE